MIMRTGTVLAATLLAACGSMAAPGNGAQAQVAATSAKPLAIAGIKIGMEGTTAASVLKRDGWVVTAVPGDTWKEAVADKVHRQRNHGVSTAYTRTGVGGYMAEKWDEMLSVTLVPTPRGGVVDLVDYRAPYAGRTFEDIRRQLVAKFGPPTSAPRPGATGFVLWRANPDADSVLFDGAAREVSFGLHSGRSESAARKAALDGAVALQMGTKSSF
jgi:hypothetical protein